MDNNKDKKNTLTISSNFKSKMTQVFKKRDNKKTFSISNDKKTS